MSQLYTAPAPMKIPSAHPGSNPFRAAESKNPNPSRLEISLFLFLCDFETYGTVIVCLSALKSSRWIRITSRTRVLGVVGEAK